MLQCERAEYCRTTVLQNCKAAGLWEHPLPEQKKYKIVEL